LLARPADPQLPAFAFFLADQQPAQPDAQHLFRLELTLFESALKALVLRRKRAIGELVIGKGNLAIRYLGLQSLLGASEQVNLLLPDVIS